MPFLVHYIKPEDVFQVAQIMLDKVYFTRGVLFSLVRSFGGKV